MSRFSRKTATGLGYLLFAMVGSAAYWSFKSDVGSTQPKLADRTRDTTPITLGASSEFATEVSALVTSNRFDDPVVDLGQTSRPTWSSSDSLSTIESLAKRQSGQALPKAYPYETVRPVAIPRDGDAIVREDKRTVLSLAPEVRSEVYVSVPPPAFQNAIPLVPLNDAPTPAPTAIAALELAQPEAAAASWSEQGARMLQEIGRTLMTPPPPQSTVSRASSNQLVVSKKPVSGESNEPPRPSNLSPSDSELRWQNPSTSPRRHFIEQPSAN